ncbi:hypothetical protein [Trinickia sp.]
MKTPREFIIEGIAGGLLLAVGAFLLEPKFSVGEVFGLYLIVRAALL